MERKFLCNCYFYFYSDEKISYSSETKIRDLIVLHLIALGYDVGDMRDYIDRWVKEKCSSSIEVLTTKDGKCQYRLRDVYSNRPMEIDSDTIKCASWEDFQFLASLENDDSTYLTNGYTWWHNDKVNPNFLSAAKRMGYRSPKIEDVRAILNDGRHFDYTWRMRYFINGRATGKTTRMVDDYVQELFKNAGEWIAVHDHYPGRTGKDNILGKLKNRMWNEHHINIEVNYQHSKIRIKPEDINFLG